ncbi:MAG: hypothetical protein WCO11_05690 [Sphingomonadales bacterium]
MSLLPVVERHLRVHGVPPSRFGRLVAGDPRFVFDLRRGREPRRATTERVLAHIASTDAQARSGAPVAGSRMEGPHATAL